MKISIELPRDLVSFVDSVIVAGEASSRSEVFVHILNYMRSFALINDEVETKDDALERLDQLTAKLFSSNSG
jgi:metal-responsive CopG/Arc/MetJ family transcriptional regulator